MKDVFTFFFIYEIKRIAEYLSFCPFEGAYITEYH